MITLLSALHKVRYCIIQCQVTLLNGMTVHIVYGIHVIFLLITIIVSNHHGNYDYCNNVYCNNGYSFWAVKSSVLNEVTVVLKLLISRDVSALDLLLTLDWHITTTLLCINVYSQLQGGPRLNWFSLLFALSTFVQFYIDVALSLDSFDQYGPYWRISR